MSADRDDRLARLVGRPGPSDPGLHRSWEQLPRADRDRLRWTATDPAAAAHLEDPLARTLVDALAADRIGRRLQDLTVPVITALLVLSTVWGFGRAAFPDVAGWFLLAALLAAAVTTVAGWRRGARARDAARAVRHQLRS